MANITNSGSNDTPASCLLTLFDPSGAEKGVAKWLNQEGSYMAAIAAGSVFKLLDEKDLGVSNDHMKEKMPPVNEGMLDGNLSWRQHDGGNTDTPNISYLISWAEEKF